MQIRNNNSIPFNGIKLHSAKSKDVLDVVLYLNRTGLKGIGEKIVYCNNNLTSQINSVKKIRSKYHFKDREYGAIFFPWSNQAYIIASPCYEQLMLPMLKQYYKNVSLNLSI